ncbi:MAG: outer membrane protein assembly factor BamC [Betaproteobacteria bacterium]|nr:outer membrane protein assembly factor BamC [Betaproteobacteria bacterium]
MKLKPVTIALIGAGLLLSLNGCSSIKNVFKSEPVDYQNVPQSHALEVPPDLTAIDTDKRYQVNESNAPTSATYSAYSAAQQGTASGRAAESSASVAQGEQQASADLVLPKPDNTVRLEHSGGERWLVVNQSPETVWPKLVKFWQDNGFKLTQNDPKIGILQTGWKDDSDKLPQDIIHSTLGKILPGMYSSGQRDQFRTRIESVTTNPNQTEIYITERTAIEVHDNSIDAMQTAWQIGPSDPGAEAEMLTRLMQDFGVTTMQAKTLLQTSAPSGLAHLAHADDGSIFLHDDEAFDPAWRRVGLALEHAGYNIVSRDRNKGMYVVTEDQTAVDDEKSTGILDKLAFWKHIGDNFTQYQIELDENAAATRTDIRVLNNEGKPAPVKIVTRIINKLFGQLK